MMSPESIHWIPCHRLSCCLSASFIFCQPPLLYFLVVAWTILRFMALVEDVKDHPGPNTSGAFKIPPVISYILPWPTRTRKNVKFWCWSVTPIFSHYTEWTARPPLSREPAWWSYSLARLQCDIFCSTHVCSHVKSSLARHLVLVHTYLYNPCCGVRESTITILGRAAIYLWGFCRVVESVTDTDNIDKKATLMRRDRTKWYFSRFTKIPAKLKFSGEHPLKNIFSAKNISLLNIYIWF
jgi:hypothetical protein